MPLFFHSEIIGKQAKALLVFAFVVLIMQGHSLRANADVELPDDELAKESVTAKFDRSTTFKNRVISLDGKVEAGVYGGWNFSEAIENQQKFGVNLGYHWSEIHSLDVNYAVWSSGLNSQYTTPLFNQYQLDFTRAPPLQSSVWLNYEANLFYGKMSLTKNTVIHFHLYPIIGVGENIYANKNYVGANAGGGWRFYLSKSVAIRTDLKFQYIGKPSPFLGGNALKSTSATPSYGSFTDETVISTIFDFGLVAVF